ncbi:hypothetical protein BDK51DRAFT_38321 [Blyttiomyces helicus]|uniref:Uncharacterized protein n=1 Tax=Blyttiomyces helicus TaxID=388810 RepID=A0A4P9WQL7_9FUNG|nr:hypothetical protein BDK51DRAFT_38321 [Blyttiomyces helicus]|eukprot:RKO94473.1 hypothetical protein BDK51DRAFT_38321 [Blyttiomyces helicus]
MLPVPQSPVVDNQPPLNIIELTLSDHAPRASRLSHVSLCRRPGGIVGSIHIVARRFHRRCPLLYILRSLRYRRLLLTSFGSLSRRSATFRTYRRLLLTSFGSLSRRSATFRTFHPHNARSTSIHASPGSTFDLSSHHILPVRSFWLSLTHSLSRRDCTKSFHDSSVLPETDSLAGEVDAPVGIHTVKSMVVEHIFIDEDQIKRKVMASSGIVTLHLLPCQCSSTNWEVEVPSIRRSGRLERLLRSAIEQTAVSVVIEKTAIGGKVGIEVDPLLNVIASLIISCVRL